MDTREITASSASCGSWDSHRQQYWLPVLDADSHRQRQLSVVYACCEGAAAEVQGACCLQLATNLALKQDWTAVNITVMFSSNVQRSGRLKPAVLWMYSGLPTHWVRAGGVSEGLTAAAAHAEP